MRDEFQADIDSVGRIAAVPTILDVICRTTGMGFATVARVTRDRWINCAVLDRIDFGLPTGGELKVETTICREVEESREPVVIDDVPQDEAYCGHPTPAMYGFRSYISMPIVRADGEFFGTLCAIDPRPARLKNPETIGMFKLFAELIAFHLDAGERLAASEASLMGERKISELREQFIAVLGHDLRNPVASIDAGTKMLLKTSLEPKALNILNLIQGSVLRMQGLIDNLLDFARGRLGGGLTLEVDDCGPLEPVLIQVVEELRATHPDTPIETDVSFTGPLRCDRARLSQLLSNLLGNALTHGADGGAVRVGASSDADHFRLWVSNSGEPIPKEALADLFQPFFRAATRPSQQGLGLGLYIASEIARAHGGTLTASSDSAETRFTFQMPLR
ncbi:GAF domain-containing sensor histidine kinase [Aurantimonas marina]|uniref:GAF domain-containing sensor histidine kinase n=1 Tax=Aurantimonas marina TaxID=2780508 RepID=UPI0019D1D52B|nr:GAF domain-containing sensor histidine kinase [Aurantimonas marina]